MRFIKLFLVTLFSVALHGVEGAELDLSMLSLSMEMEDAECEVTSCTDITYKQTEEGALQLDLYYPDRPAPATGSPLVLYIHGGGWAKGEKTIAPGWKQMTVDALTDAGFCVASVQYRLCTKDGEITIRECVIDSIDAVRFLSKHAAKYSIDPNQVFTWGDSAGGHLAQMVLIAPPEAFVGDPALADARWQMQAGVSWYGPCDFEKSDLFHKPDGTGSAERFMNRLLRGDETPEVRLAVIRELSPVTYLRADMPPLLMLQGDVDPTIPVHHAHYMKERADRVGAPVTKLIVQNASHGWNHRGEGPMSMTLEEVIDQTVGFMVAHLNDAPITLK
jgi:acetyl esterase/lipase